ncbi:WD40 repeat-like protein [Paxillus ammoniavirescens]|nr:WD40 repeat-like protein [Paxillus ammoniavirescens]
MTGAKGEMFVVACGHGLWVVGPGVQREFATPAIFESPLAEQDNSNGVSYQSARQARVPILTLQRFRPFKLYTVALPSLPSNSCSYEHVQPKGSAGLTSLTISAHEGAVYGIAYLSGGLVTCSGDETVRIWNVGNGEQAGMAMKHGGRVWGLAVTKDGKRILSGGEDKILRVWDVKTHQPIAEWGGHDPAIFCVSTSPDDQLVVSGHREGRIVIREMNLREDGRIELAIDSLAHSVSICFSPDEPKLGK